MVAGISLIHFGADLVSAGQPNADDDAAASRPGEADSSDGEPPPVEGFQQRLLAYMYLALGSLGTPLHLGGADVGEQSPHQRAHFFCYHFDTFAGLVIWKVLPCDTCRACTRTLRSILRFLWQRIRRGTVGLARFAFGPSISRLFA